MGVFIFKDGDFQPVKISRTLDAKIKPPETGSFVKPAPAKSVDIKIDSADSDFEFFEKLSQPDMGKVRSLLQAIPPEIESGDRKIIRCPNCDHKVYVQRNGENVRMICGGCGIDVSARIRKVKVTGGKEDA